jgi:hypothetical protein
LALNGEVAALPRLDALDHGRSLADAVDELHATTMGAWICAKAGDPLRFDGWVAAAEARMGAMQLQPDAPPRRWIAEARRILAGS